MTLKILLDAVEVFALSALAAMAITAFVLWALGKLPRIFRSK